MHDNEILILIGFNVKYHCGTKNYLIHTPWRKTAVKRLAWKIYSKFTSAPLTSDPGSKAAVKAMAEAIDAEFRAVCRPMIHS